MMPRPPAVAVSVLPEPRALAWAILRPDGTPRLCDADLVAAAVAEDTLPPDVRRDEAELLWLAERRAGWWGEEAAAEVVAVAERLPCAPAYTGELPW